MSKHEQKQQAHIFCRCGVQNYQRAFVYTGPPDDREVKIPVEQYYREYLKCGVCGHFIGAHNYDLNEFYKSDYVELHYGDKLKTTFEKIINLPAGKSDNSARVKNVIRFLEKNFKDIKNLKSLDVGSGLCVYSYLLKEYGLDCTALDPDPRQSEHAKNMVGVKTVTGDFFDLDLEQNYYDLISFNKVLEHVFDPVKMLVHAKKFLKPSGVIYIELPDAQGAAADKDGQNREEFFIDHPHVFSLISMCMMIEDAGFKVLETQALVEPSTKYTLRAFIAPN